MPAYCVAANCNNSQTTPSITVNELPRNRPAVRQKWIQFTQFKRADFLAAPHHAHLCSEHFDVRFRKPLGIPHGDCFEVYSISFYVKKEELSAQHHQNANFFLRIEDAVQTYRHLWTSPAIERESASPLFQWNRNTKKSGMFRVDCTKWSHKNLLRCTRQSKYVSWCFTPSQPVRLQGKSEIEKEELFAEVVILHI